MFFLILKSLILGVVFGFSYGFMFVGKLKKLYRSHLEKQDDSLSRGSGQASKNKIIFSFASFFFLIHILLISIFAYTILRFKLDISSLVITFLVSFWSYTLFTIKKNKGGTLATSFFVNQF